MLACTDCLTLPLPFPAPASPRSCLILPLPHTALTRCSYLTALTLTAPILTAPALSCTRVCHHCSCCAATSDLLDGAVPLGFVCPASNCNFLPLNPAAWQTTSYGLQALSIGSLPAGLPADAVGSGMRGVCRGEGARHHHHHRLLAHAAHAVVGGRSGAEHAKGHRGSAQRDTSRQGVWLGFFTVPPTFLHSQRGAAAIWERG